MPAGHDLDPDVAKALATIGSREINHVFFVACGGSLSIMHPAKFMLDQCSAALPSDVLNSDEFVRRAPRRLSHRSLVILCSMTGTTAETVRAAQFARAAGAPTIGMSLDIASPLAEQCDAVVRYAAHYTTGTPIDAKDSNYARIYQIVLGLSKRFDGIDRLGPLMESLGNLQAVIDAAQATFRPLFDTYAPRLADQSVIYTVASGADYGAAYSFAICVLMEMQWINSQAIHANEFFHGPFEVVDRDSSFVLFKGLDSTRPLEERAEAFLNRFGCSERILVLDAKTLDMEGIAPEFRGYLVPLVFFDALWCFAYRLAELRDHEMLKARRYMKKLRDY